MRRALLALALLLAPACADSHERAADGALDGGGLIADASIDVADAAVIDAGRDAGRVTGPGGLRCGPNTCREGEICCSESCGVCAFPSECVPTECPGP